MIKIARPFPILVAAALLAAGCVSNISKMQKLEDSMNSYEGAIRWNEFEIANGFGNGKEPVPDLERLYNLKVTAYEVRNRNISKEDLEAKQTVLVRYYEVNGMTERSTTHKQHWTYDEGLKRWTVQPSLPTF